MKYLIILNAFLFFIFNDSSACAKQNKVTYKPITSRIAAKAISKKSFKSTPKSPQKTLSKFHSKPQKSSSASLISKAHKAKYAAIVLDADTGVILHTEAADEQRFPASLTKMMTLYIAFEALREGKVSLDTPLKVSHIAAQQAPTKLALRPGETITLKNAILALVTKSANDVAVVVAEHFSGSVEAFARKMTQKARALGMSKTTFKNPHGLPNPNQVTSARDLATLSMALYHHFPNQYKYFATPSFTHKGVVHRNHNHLLGRVEGVDGIKTGLTNASGFNLAASAIRYDAQDRPRRLITVVMGGPNRHWRDRRVEQLFDIYFPHMGVTGESSMRPQNVVLKTVKKSPSERENSETQDPDPLGNLIHETYEEPRKKVTREVTEEIIDEIKEGVYEETSMESDAIDSILNGLHLESVSKKPLVSRSIKKGPYKKLGKSRGRSLTPVNWVPATPSAQRTSAKKRAISLKKSTFVKASSGKPTHKISLRKTSQKKSHRKNQRSTQI